MCGICRVWEYGASRGNVERALVERMRDVMTHRGPDDAGALVFDEGRGGLGFRRLSIIDLTKAGHQPMRGCTDRVWLVFNGEIYNHAELRADEEQRARLELIARLRKSGPEINQSLVQSPMANPEQV